jgi:hypothetical protein
MPRIGLSLFRFVSMLLLATLFGPDYSYATDPEEVPFGLDEYSSLREARAVAVAPDGKTVLFVASFVGEKGRAKREWRVSGIAGENNRNLELPESFEPIGYTRDGGFFVLLAERGKTVRMVTYPGSPHFPRLAEQRRNVLLEIKTWLTKYNP